jgi:hypothetical protein
MLASVYKVMFQMTITFITMGTPQISLNATVVKGLNNITIVRALYIGVCMFTSTILHQPNVIIH